MQLDISRDPADIVLDIPSPILSSQRIQWQTRKADWDLFESLLSAVVPAIDTPLPLPRNHAEAQSVVDERATVIRDTVIEAAHACMHTRKPGVDYNRWWSYPVENVGAIYKHYRRTIKQYARASHVHQAALHPLLKAARAKWNATYVAAHRWAWRERCQDIQVNPGMLSWARWKRTLPSAGRPVPDKHLQCNGYIASINT